MVRTLDADPRAAGRTAGRTAGRAAGRTVGRTAGRTAGRPLPSRTSVRNGNMKAKTVRTPAGVSGRRVDSRPAGRVRTESRGVRVDEASLGAGGSEVRVPRTAMSFQRVLGMVVLIAIMTVILVFYITLQAEVTNTSQQIADLEQQLTQLKAENDASYNDITDSISLEEVRRRAIHELGMKYADRDQVVIYSGTEKDTVHQVSSLNDN